MSPETLRTWSKGLRSIKAVALVSPLTNELASKSLEREVRDLRRANAILKDASVFFATELDGQTRR